MPEKKKPAKPASAREMMKESRERYKELNKGEPDKPFTREDFLHALRVVVPNEKPEEAKKED